MFSAQFGVLYCNLRRWEVLEGRFCNCSIQRYVYIMINESFLFYLKWCLGQGVYSFRFLILVDFF